MGVRTSLEMVRALVSMSDCAWVTSAPNSALNFSGSTLARRSCGSDNLINQHSTVCPGYKVIHFIRSIFGWFYTLVVAFATYRNVSDNLLNR